MPATCLPTLTTASPLLGYTLVIPNPTLQLTAFEHVSDAVYVCFFPETLQLTPEGSPPAHESTPAVSTV
jgi:hypothetical protein